MSENLWEEGDKIRERKLMAEEQIQKAVVKATLLRKRASALDEFVKAYQKDDLKKAKTYGAYSLELKAELDKLE
jgi:hypothetical protein